MVDCNNFYASCERVFNPALKNKPIVVLSNNDGCVIARSEEAKEAGIPMGAPAFKFEKEFEKHHIHVFSSNYALYGDMSRRVIETLGRFTDELEMYSIDEAFLILSKPKDITWSEFGHEIRNTVQKWTGIPVSIGMSTSKTLAKVANRIAKKNEQFSGVCATPELTNVDKWLHKIEVDDIWGIGKNYSDFLHSNGIDTALDLKKAPDVWVKKHLKVTGLRTVWELRGRPCIDLEDTVEPRKGILSSRSFGKPISDKEQIREALVSYTTRAVEKLRSQKSAASHISVFVKTNRFSKTTDYIKQHYHVTLPEPTNDTSIFLNCAVLALDKIFKPGIKYHKAGVMISAIVNENSLQTNLFETTMTDPKRSSLLKKIDSLNSKLGRNTIFFGGSNAQAEWKMKQEFMSPAYTTKWNEIPIVK